jgi:hypothetical protein
VLTQQWYYLRRDATACVCIDDDDEAMLYSAVERLIARPGTKFTTKFARPWLAIFAAR